MSTKICILVEGKTETSFKAHLVRFLQRRLAGRMPKLGVDRYDGRIPTHEALRRTVKNLLQSDFDHVIALTDVYTGNGDFTDAADAKAKMRSWAGAHPDCQSQ